MKCLLCYEWVKLPRNRLPEVKGVMGAWAKLASRVAYRKGTAKYCGYENEVNAGMWAGGVVGLKSILGIKNRTKALSTLDELVRLGLVTYTLDEKTKKLELILPDWVHKCDGSECMSNSVYVTEGCGFLCIPRSITERLVEQNYIFEEADAWLDLWCHTVHCDFSNAFSFAAPAVQYGKQGSILTLDTLGKRWNWEKTKVWRFFQKHKDTFALRRLPSSYGCVIFNGAYPDDQEYTVPSTEDTIRIWNEMRNTEINTHSKVKPAYFVARCSRRFLDSLEKRVEFFISKSRVALFAPIIRAYLSHKNCKNIYDCKDSYIYLQVSEAINGIRGPSAPVDITKIAKEMFVYESTLCSRQSNMATRHSFVNFG